MIVLFSDFKFDINPCYPESFSKHIFVRGVVAIPLWIINTEGHITLNYYQCIGMDIFFPLIPK